MDNDEKLIILKQRIRGIYKHLSKKEISSQDFEQLLSKKINI